MGWAHRLDSVPETRHLAQATHAGSHAERTLAPELDSDEAERLIARGNERKLGAAKDVGRQLRELGLAKHPPGVLFHQLLQLERGEATIKIDNGSNGNEL